MFVGAITPTVSSGVSLAGASASANILLNTLGDQVLVTNLTSYLCYVNFGGSGVSASASDDWPVPAGEQALFTRAPAVHTYAAAICTAGDSVSILFHTGYGS